MHVVIFVVFFALCVFPTMVSCSVLCGFPVVLHEQMEGVDGTVRESSRRRSQVPTLGPLSYSLPVTPQGRQSHGTPDRSGEMDNVLL